MLITANISLNFYNISLGQQRIVLFKKEHIVVIFFYDLVILCDL